MSTLRQRMVEEMQLRRFAKKTQDAIRWSRIPLTTGDESILRCEDERNDPRLCDPLVPDTPHDRRLVAPVMPE